MQPNLRWGEEGLGRVEDVWVSSVGQEGAAHEGLALVFYPPVKIFERQLLPAPVDLLLVRLPLYAEHLRGREIGEHRHGRQNVGVSLQFKNNLKDLKLVIFKYWISSLVAQQNQNEIALAVSDGKQTDCYWSAYNCTIQLSIHSTQLSTARDPCLLHLSWIKPKKSEKKP